MMAIVLVGYIWDVSLPPIRLDTAGLLARAQDPAYWRDAVPGQLLIRYRDGARETLLSRLSSRNLRIIKESRAGGRWVVVECTDPQGLMEKALSWPEVMYAEPPRRLRALWTPNDAYWRELWGLYVMYLDKAWDITRGSRDVVVAVVDEGTDYLHPDLAGAFGSEKGYDFVDGDSDPYPDDLSKEFHGTHVSGTIAAVADNGIGVAGVGQFTLLSVRVLDETGSGYDYDVADGIRWAADRGARVVNLSLGGSQGSAVLQEACNYAYDTAGVVVVAAAGNDGMSYVNYPAAYNSVIAVSALDTSSTLACFSNYGPEVEVAAPGEGILSTIPNGQYAWADGTSMATPHVAGLAALVISANPSLPADTVRLIIDGTAMDEGSSGRDWSYGYGIVDALEAVRTASSWGGPAKGGF